METPGGPRTPHGMPTQDRGYAHSVNPLFGTPGLLPAPAGSVDQGLLAKSPTPDDTSCTARTLGISFVVILAIIGTVIGVVVHVSMSNDDYHRSQNVYAADSSNGRAVAVPFSATTVGITWTPAPGEEDCQLAVYDGSGSLVGDLITLTPANSSVVVADLSPASAYTFRFTTAAGAAHAAATTLAPIDSQSLVGASGRALVLTEQNVPYSAFRFLKAAIGASSARITFDGFRELSVAPPATRHLLASPSPAVVVRAFTFAHTLFGAANATCKLTLLASHFNSTTPASFDGLSLQVSIDPSFNATELPLALPFGSWIDQHLTINTRGSITVSTLPYLETRAAGNLAIPAGLSVDAGVRLGGPLGAQLQAVAGPWLERQVANLTAAAGLEQWLNSTDGRVVRPGAGEFVFEWPRSQGLQLPRLLRSHGLSLRVQGLGRLPELLLSTNLTLHDPAEPPPAPYNCTKATSAPAGALTSTSAPTSAPSSTPPHSTNSSGTPCSPSAPSRPGTGVEFVVSGSMRLEAGGAVGLSLAGEQVGGAWASPMNQTWLTMDNFTVAVQMTANITHPGSTVVSKVEVTANADVTLGHTQAAASATVEVHNDGSSAALALEVALRSQDALLSAAAAAYDPARLRSAPAVLGQLHLPQEYEVQVLLGRLPAGSRFAGAPQGVRIVAASSAAAVPAGGAVAAALAALSPASTAAAWGLELLLPVFHSGAEASARLTATNFQLVNGTVRCPHLYVDASLGNHTHFTSGGAWEVGIPGQGRPVGFAMFGNFTAAARAWAFSGALQATWRAPFGLPWLNITSAGAGAALGELRRGNHTSPSFGLQELWLEGSARMRFGGVLLASEVTLNAYDSWQAYGLLTRVDVPAHGLTLSQVAEDILPAANRSRALNYTLLDDVEVSRLSLGVSASATGQPLAAYPQLAGPHLVPELGALEAGVTLAGRAGVLPGTPCALALRLLGMVLEDDIPFNTTGHLHLPVHLPTSAGGGGQRRQLLQAGSVAGPAAAAAAARGWRPSVVRGAGGPVFELREAAASILHDHLRFYNTSLSVPLQRPLTFNVSSVWEVDGLGPEPVQFAVAGALAPGHRWSVRGATRGSPAWRHPFGLPWLEVASAAMRADVGHFTNAAGKTEFGLTTMEITSNATVSAGGQRSAVEMRTAAHDNVKQFVSTLQWHPAGGAIAPLAQAIHPSNSSAAAQAVNYTLLGDVDVSECEIAVRSPHTVVDVACNATVRASSRAGAAVGALSPASQPGTFRVAARLHLPVAALRSPSPAASPADAAYFRLWALDPIEVVEDRLACTAAVLHLALAPTLNVSVAATWSLALEHEPRPLLFDVRADLACPSGPSSCVLPFKGFLAGERWAHPFGLHWMDVTSAQVSGELAATSPFVRRVSLATRVELALFNRTGHTVRSAYSMQVTLLDSLRNWYIELALAPKDGNLQRLVGSVLNVTDDGLDALASVHGMQVMVVLTTTELDIPASEADAWNEVGLSAASAFTGKLSPGLTVVAAAALEDGGHARGLRALVSDLAHCPGANATAANSTAGGLAGGAAAALHWSRECTARGSVYEFQLHLPLFQPRGGARRHLAQAPDEDQLSFRLSLPELRISRAWEVSELSMQVALGDSNPLAPLTAEIESVFEVALHSNPPLDFVVAGRYAAPNAVQLVGGMAGSWDNAFGLHGLSLRDTTLAVSLNPSDPSSGGADVYVAAAVDVGRVTANASVFFAPEVPYYGVVALDVEQLTMDNLVLFWNENFAAHPVGAHPVPTSAAGAGNYSVDPETAALFADFMVKSLRLQLSDAHLTVPVPRVAGGRAVLVPTTFWPGLNLHADVTIFGVEVKLDVRTESRATVDVGAALGNLTVPAAQLLAPFSLPANDVIAVVTATFASHTLNVTAAQMGTTVELLTLLQQTRPAIEVNLAALAGGLVSDVSAWVPAHLRALVSGHKVGIGELVARSTAFTFPLAAVFANISCPVHVPAALPAAATHDSGATYQVGVAALLGRAYPSEATYRQRLHLAALAPHARVPIAAPFQGLHLQVPDLFMSFDMNLEHFDIMAIVHDLFPRFDGPDNAHYQGNVTAACGKSHWDDLALGDIIPAVHEIGIYNLSMTELARGRGPTLVLNVTWLGRAHTLHSTFDVSAIANDLSQLVHATYEHLVPECFVDAECPAEQRCSHTHSTGAAPSGRGAAGPSRPFGWRCAAACSDAEYSVPDIGCFPKLQEGMLCLTDAMCASGDCPDFFDTALVESSPQHVALQQAGAAEGATPHICYRQCKFCPSAPLAVAAGNRTTASIEVAWLAPDVAPYDWSDQGAYPIDSYEVSYQTTDWMSDPVVAAAAAPASARSLVVPALHPDKEYQFRVRAHNANGFGSYSSWSTRTQLCQVDSVQMQAPYLVSQDGGDKMVVGWDTSLGGCGAAAATYSIRVLQSCVVAGIVTAPYLCTNDWRTLDHVTAPLTISGLEPNTQYQLQVKSDQNAEDEWSDTSEVMRTCGGPGAPGKPYMRRPALEKEIAVEFALARPVPGCADDPSGVPYRLWICAGSGPYAGDFECESQMEDTLTCHPDAANSCTVTISNVQQDRQYQVRAASSRYGAWGAWSAPSAPLYAAHPPAPPPPPAACLGCAHPDTIDLQLTSPADNGGSAVTHFSLTYRVCDDWWTGYTCTFQTERSLADVARPAANSTVIFTVAGLESDTNYDFRVKACNAEGCSSESDWSSTITTSK